MKKFIELNNTLIPVERIYYVKNMTDYVEVSYSTVNGLTLRELVTPDEIYTVDEIFQDIKLQLEGE